MSFSSFDLAFVSKVYTLDVDTAGENLTTTVSLFSQMFADYPMIRWAHSEVDVLLWHSATEVVTEEGEEPNVVASTRPVRLLTRLDTPGQETPWTLDESATWDSPLEIKDLPPSRDLVLVANDLEGDEVGFTYKARVYLLVRLRRAAAG
jgi:hypothetical protein